MIGEEQDTITVWWWEYATDLLGHRSLVHCHENFNNLNKAIEFALKLKDNDDIDSFEIRFY